MADKPKLNMSRRGFLGLLGGGIAAALTGGLKTAPKVAATAAKVIPEISAQGMPTWFPSLVNKIKTQGKQTTTATGGRNSENTYKLNDREGANEYILTEDVTTGNIQVFSKGDDYQQVNFEYIPATKYSRPDGKSFVEEGEFYGYEKYKTDGPDVEVEGTFDEMQGGYKELETFATKGKKTSAEKLDEIAADFKKATEKEDLDGFAKGGRVGYKNGGGVGTLFKEKRT